MGALNPLPQREGLRKTFMLNMACVFLLLSRRYHHSCPLLETFIPAGLVSTMSCICSSSFFKVRVMSAC